MRILCLGDLHTRQTVPENRSDSFYDDLLQKLYFITDYADNNDVQVVLLPGDIFHSPIQPYSLLIKMIKILQGHDFSEIKYFGVYGQHDLLFHNKENKDVALNVLEAAKVITICDDTPILYKGVNFYGCSWGEEIPSIINDGVNILLMHKMVIAEKKLWGEQTEYTKSQSLLRKYTFDLIVAGDNHKTFQDNYRNRHLVNCGSLMRSNTDQREHKPCFFVYDTSAKLNKLKKIEIPVKPEKQVFTTRKLKKRNKTNFEDKFTSSFDKEHEFTIDFKKNVMRIMSQTDDETLSANARMIVTDLLKEELDGSSR